MEAPVFVTGVDVLSGEPDVSALPEDRNPENPSLSFRV